MPGDLLVLLLVFAFMGTLTGAVRLERRFARRGAIPPPGVRRYRR